jgi:hypothetical protein
MDFMGFWEEMQMSRRIGWLFFNANTPRRKEEVIPAILCLFTSASSLHSKRRSTQSASGWCSRNATLIAFIRIPAELASGGHSTN